MCVVNLQALVLLFSCSHWLWGFRKGEKAANPALERACEEITIPGVFPWAEMRQPLHSHASLTIGSFSCLFPQKCVSCSFAPHSCLLALRWPRCLDRNLWLEWCALPRLSLFRQGFCFLSSPVGMEGSQSSCCTPHGVFRGRTFDICTLFSAFSQLCTGKTRTSE